MQCCFYFLCQSTLKFYFHVVITKIPFLTVICIFSIMFSGRAIWQAENLNVKCTGGRGCLGGMSKHNFNLLEYIYMYANTTESDYNCMPRGWYHLTFCSIFAFATSPLSITVKCPCCYINTWDDTMLHIEVYIHSK